MLKLAIFGFLCAALLVKAQIPEGPPDGPPGPPPPPGPEGMPKRVVRQTPAQLPMGMSSMSDMMRNMNPAAMMQNFPAEEFISRGKEMVAQFMPGKRRRREAENEIPRVN